MFSSMLPSNIEDSLHFAFDFSHLMLTKYNIIHYVINIKTYILFTRYCKFFV